MKPLLDVHNLSTHIRGEHETFTVVDDVSLSLAAGETIGLVGESGSGHSVIMDGSPDSGGRDLAPRPMEMVLIGMGGCTAFDVMMILKKARQPVKDCVVELEAQRAETEPKVFTKIHIHFIVTGAGVSDNHLQRAIKLSAEKYCSASIMLEKAGVAITHSHEIRDTA